jgi:hypothetical protein
MNLERGETVRKSKTRRHVAVKTAAVAAAGAGILFGAMPAIASISAAPKTVNYSCVSTVPGAATPSATATYAFQMDVTGPLATPTPNATVVATWKIGQPLAAPQVTAAATIPATGRLSVEADVAISGTPLPTPSEVRAVTATAVPAGATVGQQLVLPPMLVTMTPTATGPITIRPEGFTLYVDAAGTGATDAELLDCTITPEAAAAGALVINVQASGTGASNTPSTTPPVTPPTTPPVTAPSPTVTITQTKTSQPISTRQIDETPAGAASTGGGGDAGPDARYIMLSGALMVAFAGIGGLVLRRRTATRS